MSNRAVWAREGGVTVQAEALAEALSAEEVASAADNTSDSYVLSVGRAGGIWHRVTASGRSGPSGLWSTACG